MIEFKNVSKHFGPTKVLHDIDLKINQGAVVVIIHSLCSSNGWLRKIRASPRQHRCLRSSALGM